MLSAARSSNELMDLIARQSQDQASSIEEINAAVRRIDEMTQDNAALVEETNASIEQTEEQAVQLDGIVEVFRIASEDGAAPLLPRAAAAERRHPTETKPARAAGSRTTR